MRKLAKGEKLLDIERSGKNWTKLNKFRINNQADSKMNIVDLDAFPTLDCLSMIAKNGSLQVIIVRDREKEKLSIHGIVSKN